jgi:hypothetical protein
VHRSRFGNWPASVTEQLTISSSQRRPRAIASTDRAACGRLCSCCGGNSPSFQKRDRREEIVAANPKMPRHYRICRTRMVEGVNAFFLGLDVGFDQRNGPVQVGNEDAQLQPAILARSEQSLGSVYLCLKMVRVVRIDRRTCIRRAARIIGRTRNGRTPWPLRASARRSSVPPANGARDGLNGNQNGPHNATPLTYLPVVSRLSFR